MDKRSALRRLAQLRDLEPDWNGYGAKPPRRSAVAAAEQLVHRCGAAPEVFPTGRRSVQLQWTRDYGYLELEVVNATRVEGLFVPGPPDARCYSDGVEFTTTVAEAPGVVARFIDGQGV